MHAYEPIERRPKWILICYYFWIKVGVLFLNKKEDLKNLRNKKKFIDTFIYYMKFYKLSIYMYKNIFINFFYFEDV
jgi:hypothetical protein